MKQECTALFLQTGETQSITILNSHTWIGMKTVQKRCTFLSGIGWQKCDIYKIWGYKVNTENCCGFLRPHNSIFKLSHQTSPSVMYVHPTALCYPQIMLFLKMYLMFKLSSAVPSYNMSKLVQLQPSGSLLSKKSTWVALQPGPVLGCVSGWAICLLKISITPYSSENAILSILLWQS